MRRAPLYTGRAPPTRPPGGGDCGEWNRPGHAERRDWVTGGREPARRADWSTLPPPSSPSLGAVAAESGLLSWVSFVCSLCFPLPRFPSPLLPPPHRPPTDLPPGNSPAAPRERLVRYSGVRELLAALPRHFKPRL